MQLASRLAFPEPLLAAMPQLREKPHLGFRSKNPAWHPGFNVCNSTAVLGLQFRCSETVSGPVVAPNNGPSYTRADVCAASTLLNKGGATFLDALGMIPGEGNLLAGVQLGAGLLSAGMTIFGESSPADAGFSGAGLGLSAADLSGTAKITAKVFGKSLRVVPVAGNVLSGIATYRDIFGKDGMSAYYNDCMAGKN